MVYRDLWIPLNRNDLRNIVHDISGFNEYKYNLLINVFQVVFLVWMAFLRSSQIKQGWLKLREN